MQLGKRQRETMDHVKASLAEHNYAVCHRDDLFGDDASEAWDAAEQFMETFAASETARQYERSHTQLIQDNLDLNAREEREVAAAATAVADGAERQAAVAAEAKAVLAAHVKAPTRDSRAEAIRTAAEAKAAAVAFKAATVRQHDLLKSLATERKTLNRVFKPYIFHGTAYLGRAVTYSDPPIALTGEHRFLDIADDYYGEPAKIRIATIWRVSPVPAGVPLPPRKGSQLWHRDQTDHKILKLFIYFTDVDEGSGALEYVPDSRPLNSRWGEAIPLLENSGYPPQELVAEKVPSDQIVKCTGRKGTIAFVDTAGLHRGGYATTGPRVSVQSTFLRREPLLPQNPMLTGGMVDPSLSDRQRYAFS